ncbi:MAG: hypothetical protein ACKVS6_06885 [Planctomycetota bacterium]
MSIVALAVRIEILAHSQAALRSRDSGCLPTLDMINDTVSNGPRWRKGRRAAAAIFRGARVRCYKKRPRVGRNSKEHAITVAAGFKQLMRGGRKYQFRNGSVCGARAAGDLLCCVCVEDVPDSVKSARRWGVGGI